MDIGAESLGVEPHVAFVAVLLVSLPIAAMLSLGVVWHYRRAVLRSMQSTAQGTPGDLAPDLAAIPSPITAPAAERGLHIQTVDRQSSLPHADAGGLLARGRQARRRAGTVYAIAGMVHAAIATVVFFLLNDIEFLPVRTLSVWFLFAWPVVPTLVLVAVGNRFLKWLGPAAFLAISWLLSPIPFRDFVLIWGVYMALPTVFWMVLGNRHLRAVGPILLALVFLVVAGAFTALWFGLWLLLRSGNLDAWPMALGIALVIMAGFSVVAWRFLRWIAGRYQRRRISDQGLLLDAWWLLFTLYQCVFLFIAAGFVGLLGLLSFAGYWLVVTFGFRPIQAGASRYPPVRLLLLRVFGFRARSEHLLAELAQQWRYVGNVHLIAAPDLASATLEPHEFLNYARGRLDRAFIKGPEDLDDRLRQVDESPDPDGRFRIQGYYCHDDTWRMTLKRLAVHSDAVLMDLRGFGPNNQGCTYELYQLVDLVPLSRVILTVDRTTDEDFLHTVLQAAWEAASARPADPAPPLRIMRVERQTPAEVRRLFALLETAADSGGSSADASARRQAE